MRKNWDLHNFSAKRLIYKEQFSLVTYKYFLNLIVLFNSCDKMPRTKPTTAKDRKMIREEALTELTKRGISKPHSKSALHFLRITIPKIRASYRERERLEINKANAPVLAPSFDSPQEEQRKSYGGFPRTENPQVLAGKKQYQARAREDELQTFDDHFLLAMMNRHITDGYTMAEGSRAEAYVNDMLRRYKRSHGSTEVKLMRIERDILIREIVKAEVKGRENSDLTSKPNSTLYSMLYNLLYSGNGFEFRTRATRSLKKEASEFYVLHTFGEDLTTTDRTELIRILTQAEEYSKV